MSPGNRWKYQLRRVVHAIVAVLAAALGGGAAEPERRDPTSPIWFDQLRSAAPVSATDGLALVTCIASALARNATPQHQEFPAAVQADTTAPRMLFLTIGDGRRPSCVVFGAGLGLPEAGQFAVERLLPHVADFSRPLWVKLDVVQLVLPPVVLSPDSNISGFERSLQGLALDRELGVAFLPEELVAATLVNSEGQPRPRNMARYLERRCPSVAAPPGLATATVLRARPFTAVGFFHDGTRAVPLYRGHRLFRQLTCAELDAAARAGGAYLTRAIDSTGRFAYKYLPKTDEEPETYNLTRHAGTLFAMADLLRQTGDHTLRDAVDRGLDYLVAQAKPYGPRRRNMVCLVDGDKIKLGTVALAVVAIVEHASATGDLRHQTVAQRLGHYLLDAQQKDGQFVCQRAYPGGAPLSFVSEYYPGEAVLAFARLHGLDGDTRWLDAAERGAQYLIKVRDKDLSLNALPHDHWLLYALDVLYRARPDPLYLEHALRLAQAIRQTQHRYSPYADYLGGYYDPPRNAPTATRAEGLLAAHRLARDFGRPEEAKAILDAAAWAVSFVLQTQFAPETVLYLGDPGRALGGFRRELTNYEIRIDYVQHSLSALLALRRAMEDDGCAAFVVGSE